MTIPMRGPEPELETRRRVVRRGYQPPTYPPTRTPGDGYS